MQSTMENVKNILKVDTVVGDPIYTPDGITLVPISKISVGFGGGGVEFGSKKEGERRPYGGGNATGVKVEPIGFLIIKDGVVRMINVTPPAVIMMIGLQGSGKTTSTAKIARRLQTRERKKVLIFIVEASNGQKVTKRAER